MISLRRAWEEGPASLPCGSLLWKYFSLLCLAPNCTNFKTQHMPCALGSSRLPAICRGELDSSASVPSHLVPPGCAPCHRRFKNAVSWGQGPVSGRRYHCTTQHSPDTWPMPAGSFSGFAKRNDELTLSARVKLGERTLF
uniref:Uncharacterized protein n=1 Tax=Molossus molossus TaxID=27622 RepID=A0A7J8CZG6_MOLMO|nr:hypothetical protein HJG59_009431 [Molossus molossus]